MRKLLHIHGPNAQSLLQGTFTQDISTLTENELRYGAHLTPQGKIIADALISIHEGGYLLDIHSDALMPLAESLNHYAIQGEVEFEDITDELSILYAFDKSEGEDFLPDPRLPTLPYRKYTKSSQKHENFAEIAEITAHLPHIFPMLAAHKMLPAEVGLEYLNGVSFTKGCYVGQEVTSRMKNKTTPKKRLYVVEYAEAIEFNTPIVTETGATAGYVLQSGNGQHLALLGTRFIEKPVYIGEKRLPQPFLPAYIKA